jgi:hypothetical protein
LTMLVMQVMVPDFGSGEPVPLLVGVVVGIHW